MWVGGVRVVILDEENRMLMVRQCHEEKDIWMIPGGGIEEGESSVEAAAREVKEETGLDVEVGRMIWHVEEVSDRGQRFVNFFIARVVGGMLALGKDPEFDCDNQVLREVKFMTKDEIQQLPKIYPIYLKDEIWQILSDDYSGCDVFKLRDSYKNK